MENENVEQTTVQTEQSNQQNVNNQQPQGNGFFSKITSWVKSHKKILAIIVAIIVVAIIAYAIISSVIGSPESAVKKYVSALNKMDGEKIVSAMDIQGAVAYSECTSSSYFSSTFDASKFEEKYKDVEKDDIKSKKESIIESYKDSEKEDSASIKLLRIKEVEESDDCKDLYSVTAKIRVSYKDDDGDKQDNAIEMNFYVYKNKVIAVNTSSLSKLLNY